MWKELVPTRTGGWAYQAGASGTVTLPAGARILNIIAHATSAGTVAILGGTAIPIIAGTVFQLQFMHELATANTNASAPAGSATVVFTGTDSYYVEYVV